MQAIVDQTDLAPEGIEIAKRKFEGIQYAKEESKPLWGLPA